MTLIVYFSTKSRNTHKFVHKLNLPCIELKQNSNDSMITIDHPFVLITPTYGGGYLKGAVPPQVIRFLNNEHNRNNMIGVVSTGNRNFGEAFCLAGRVIADKCGVPNLADVELFGTAEDVQHTRQAIINLFEEETDE